MDRKCQTDFRRGREWLDEAGLDRVGCFTYSPVDGAQVNMLPDSVPKLSRTSAGSL